MPDIHMFPQGVTDLSEKILKIYKQTPNRFGKQGFGVYDWGEKQYKIFNWNLEIEKRIPITIGEGPGEIKPWVFNACLFNERLYLNGYLDRKIHVYGIDGKFETSISLDFSPRCLCSLRDKLYVFNSEFFTSNDAVLARVIHLESGRFIKDIKLKNSVKTTGELSGKAMQMMFRYDVDDNGTLFVLNIMKNQLLPISENGEPGEVINLPRRANIKYSSSATKDAVLTTLSMFDFYQDFKIIGKQIFLCFLKTLKYDESTGETVLNTYLVKMDTGGGEISERKFPGSCIILGENQGTLYLFNREDYSVIPVSLHFSQGK